MAIRYDKKFNNEINRVVRNYNRKVKRLNEKGITTPLKIRVRDIKNNASSRKEIRKVLRDLKYYSSRGSEKIKDGYNISNYDYRILKRTQKEAIKNINRQLKDFEEIIPTVFGKKQTLTSAQMKEDRYINLKGRKEIINRTNFKLIKPQDVKKLLQTFERNKYILDYKEWQERYIGIFEDTLNTYISDKNKIYGIVDKLKQMSPEKFDKMIRFEKSFRAILDYYAMMKDLENPFDIETEVETIFNELYESSDFIINEYEVKK